MGNNCCGTTIKQSVSQDKINNGLVMKDVNTSPNPILQNPPAPQNPFPVPQNQPIQSYPQPPPYSQPPPYPQAPQYLQSPPYQPMPQKPRKKSCPLCGEEMGSNFRILKEFVGPCAVCNKGYNMSQGENVYRCHKCNTSFHINCVN